MKRLLFNRSTQTPAKDKKVPSYHNLLGSGPGVETTFLSPDASVAFLRNAAPRFNKTPDDQLKSLAEALNYQPQALYLAGRFLQKRWYWTLKRYMTTLDLTIRTLQGGVPQRSAAELQPEERSMAAALLLSFQLLEGKSQKAVISQAVFRFTGYCAPGISIPVRLLQAAADVEPDDRYAFFQSALTRLYAYGFLKWSKNGPMIHEAAAAAARRLDDDENNALDSLTSAGIALCELAVDQPEQAELLSRVAPHMEAAAHLAEKGHKERASEVWHALGRALWANQNLPRALHCFEQGLRVNESLYGMLHSSIAADCSILGRVHHDMGDLRAARSYFLRAIMVTEKVFSYDYPGIAEDSARLGRLLHEMEDLPGARAMFERALAIHEKSFDYGPRHPLTGSDLHQLGLVLYDLGLWEEAKQRFDQAAAVHKWVYGPLHGTVLEDLIQLGMAQRAAGELHEAKETFEQVAELEGKIFNRPNYRSPATLNNLGLVLQDLGDLQGARKCFERAMVVDEEVLGLEHPDVARDVNNLGCVLREMGDLPTAQMYFHRAFAIYELTYGPEHPILTVSANNMARVLFAQKDFEGAREYFERVLAIDEKEYGLDHLEVAPDAANLGMALYELGAVEEAQKYFERSWEILSKTLPPDHPGVINAQKLLDRCNRSNET